jgi:signal transduction histidine kinase
MWHSLRVKILGAMVLVVIAGVAITAWYATRSTTGAFRQYVTQGQALRESHITLMLTNYYANSHSWAGIQPFANQMGSITGERIVLTDVQGNVIADSQGILKGKLMGTTWNSRILGPDRTLVGYLYFNLPEEIQARITDYLLSITRSVWVGALVAVAIALLVTWLLSPHILRPIEDLTAAANRMQKGDLSARVKAASKDEVGQLAASFNAMAESLAKQEQLRKNLVSDVAHELRTPLTNIRGYLEAARDGILPSDLDLVNNLFDEATLLSRLVDDLQDLAQAEAGHLRLELTAVNLGQVIQATIDNMLPISQKQELEITCAIPPDLPAVMADPQRLGQVLRNLINNALDYTHSGGQIWIRAIPDDQYVRVSVQDTGPGIEAKHLPYLFERFYRPDPSRARSTGGVGLGLAIVKQFVQAQGGQVGVESTINQGSTFYFTVPVYPPD